MHDYNRRAKIYWFSVAVIGYALLVHAAFAVSSFDNAAQLQILIGVCLTSFVSFFPVHIPRAKIAVVGGEIFIFLTLLLFGVEAAVLVAAVDGFVGAKRSSKRWTSWFGTPAMAAITMTITGTLFVLLKAALQFYGLLNAASLLLTLTLFSVLYYFGSFVMPSTLIALKRDEPISPLLWLKNLSWIAIAYVSSAAIAALLHEAALKYGVVVLIAAIPIIVMFLMSAHFIFDRSKAIEESQAKLLEMAKRESMIAIEHAVELKISEERFHSAFTNAAIGMTLVDQSGNILQVNQAACRLFGYEENELIGSALRALLPADDVTLLLKDIAALHDGGESPAQRELHCFNKAGDRLSVAFNVSYFQKAASYPADVIVQIQDISDRKKIEESLLHIAYHDALTGLPNRVYFRAQLAKAIARLKRNPSAQFAVMFLDFDRFKSVNDSLGHSAGDQLLIAFSKRIQAALRPADMVARLGGDEFAVLVEDMQSNTSALDLAKRLQEMFLEPFRTNDTDITSSASIGICYSAARHETPDDVIRDADLAMYKAKASGKAQHAVFDLSLHDRATADLQLENELRRAIAVGELRLHYQPQHRFGDRSLYGYEALIRWAHPKRGLLYPATFLGVAQETGLIFPIGRWVITEACAQMKRWREKDQNRDREHGTAQTLRMSVNISSHEFNQPNFVPFVIDTLDKAEVPAECLTIELTESALMDGAKGGVAALNALRAAGVKISIDDFGTGYSSLSYLATLPIDSIKIDQSFINQMTETPESKEIVRAITTLGRALGKSVFAEGVETEAQWRTLVELGCDYGQGNLCSPAISADEIAQRISGSRLIRVAT
jgi:diguanylate cyclase (GGDEF)-like protein/PAS domain S-box-containing protein